MPEFLYVVENMPFVSLDEHGLSAWASMNSAPLGPEKMERLLQALSCVWFPDYERDLAGMNLWMMRWIERGAPMSEIERIRIYVVAPERAVEVWDARRLNA